MGVKINFNHKLLFAVFIIAILSFSLVSAKNDDNNGKSDNSKSSAEKLNNGKAVGQTGEKSNNGNAYGKDKGNNGKALGQDKTKKGKSNLVTGMAITEPVPLLKTILNLFLDKLSVLKGEMVNINARLSKEDNSPIPDKELVFSVNEEKIGSKLTDNKGIADIEWDTSVMKPGTYTINVNFPGDDTLESSSASNKVLIKDILNETINQTQRIQKIEDCKESSWDEKEIVYDTCSETRTVKTCYDEPKNTTCRDEQKEFTYSCEKEKSVKKSQKNCIVIGYIIDGKIKLNTKDYVCSIKEESNSFLFVCDSIYDGNGDGICSSGESCINFIVDYSKASRKEKNSRNDYVEQDKSYFLERPLVTALK